jgi:hypothetical protein
MQPCLLYTILRGTGNSQPMHYDPNSGYLYHQWVEYRPISTG